ncbi:MAG: hypothetical protein GXO93_02500, partial [FCB group bacterium]|nr:hypothetical protein [FCB group bacterium]
GVTTSLDFPTFNPYQGTLQGTGDAFVTKFSSGGCCVGMRGNVDNDPDDKVNISDVMYLINYAFSGGPAPQCMEEADVNGDGSVNVVDINYLTNYMFEGGPAPVACP